MSNLIRILFQEKEQDKIFDYFKQQFGARACDVQVDTILDDSLIELSWDDNPNDYDLALALTEQFPAAVIETRSTTQMDLSSRFFNGTQLW